MKFLRYNQPRKNTCKDLDPKERILKREVGRHMALVEHLVLTWTSCLDLESGS